MANQYMLETPRLGFRLWKESDKESYVLLGQDPDVMAFYPHLFSEEESLVHLEGVNDPLTQGQMWAVELKETKEFIGTIGTVEIPFEPFFVSGLEIGWRLHKRFWGQGFATEGALAVLKYIENNRIVPEIFAYAAEQNSASINIMEKIGMEYHSHFAAPDMDWDSPFVSHVLYSKNF